MCNLHTSAVPWVHIYFGRVLTIAANRVILNLEECVDVINEHKNEKAERKLAQTFYCGKKQSKFWRIKFILKEWQGSKSCGMKRKWKKKKLNVVLNKWFQAVTAKNIPLNGT